MPKAEKGSIKWLANKMKSKGLQKLRWYCQMCQKQCRDENGFKCHIQSEAHQRQLLIFADNPGKFLGNFSKEFEDGFMSLLKRAHGTKRVEANKVYQEYIHDKDHVHMNATRWESLTGFIHYLGRTGKCVVDQTEKGWYITWIDREPETIARQERLARKDKLDKDDNERMQDFIDKQVERAKKSKQDEEGERYTELLKSEDEILTLSMAMEKKPSLAELAPKTSGNVFKSSSASSSGVKVKKEKDIKKKSALEEIMEEESAKKERLKKENASKSKSSKNPDVKDYWLQSGIVVKIVTKSLGDKYYKQKGYVKQVVDRYGAVVVLLGDNSKLKLDQDHLETVIPAAGKKVKVVNGYYRKEDGILEEIDVDNFCAKIKLCEDGKIVKLPYEHFSKIHQV